VFFGYTHAKAPPARDQAIAGPRYVRESTRGLGIAPFTDFRFAS
jgi:hypothetical protein